MSGASQHGRNFVNVDMSFRFDILTTKPCKASGIYIYQWWRVYGRKNKIKYCHFSSTLYSSVNFISLLKMSVQKSTDCLTVTWVCWTYQQLKFVPRIKIHKTRVSTGNTFMQLSTVILSNYTLSKAVTFIVYWPSALSRRRTVNTVSLVSRHRGPFIS